MSGKKARIARKEENEKKKLEVLERRQEREKSYPDQEVTLLYIGEDTISLKRGFGRNPYPIPTGAVNGSIAEIETLQAFIDAGVPLNNILESTKIKDIEGEDEISDGIVIFGNTAFLIQTKSRGTEPLTRSKEFKKIKKLVSECYDQFEDSLRNLEKHHVVCMKSKSGGSLEISKDDFNWVSLNVVNHNNIPNTLETNELIFENNKDYPRIVISLEDLKMISSKSHSYFAFLSYLRKLSNISFQRMGEEIINFSTMQDTKIYVPTFGNPLFALSDYIDSSYGRGEVSRDLVAKIYRAFDTIPPVELEKVKKSFIRNYSSAKLSLTNSGSSLSIFSTDEVVFTFMFYNSNLVDSDIETVKMHTRYVAHEQYEKFLKRGNDISTSICIAFDIYNKSALYSAGTLVSVIP